MQNPTNPKTVWLVRHGLTVSNVSGTVQGLDDPLTPEGEKQAEKVAERLSNIPFDALLSSDAIRARHTAEAIARKSGHTIEETPLLREITYPTALIGLLRSDDPAQEYFSAGRESIGDLDWKYEDEESFREISKRAESSLALFLSHEKENLVVVTHGKFIKRIAAQVMFGNDLDPLHWQKFDRSLRTLNTGVTLIRHDGIQWVMISWNDHAHLAE